MTRCGYAHLISFYVALQEGICSVKTLKSIHVGCKLKLFKTVERATKKGHKSFHTTELFSRSNRMHGIVK